MAFMKEAIMSSKLVERFLSLAVIPAPSKKESRMAARVKEELLSMGLECREDDAAGRVEGEVGNLIVERLPSGNPST